MKNSYKVKCPSILLLSLRIHLIMFIAEAKIHKLASNFMHFGIRSKYFLDALHFGKWPTIVLTYWIVQWFHSLPTKKLNSDNQNWSQILEITFVLIWLVHDSALLKQHQDVIIFRTLFSADVCFCTAPFDEFFSFGRLRIFKFSTS